MTNKQIVVGAIEKAEKNGFNIEIFWHFLKNPDSTVSPSTSSATFLDENIDEIMEHSNELLFDHDFAEAFWGDGIIVTDILDPLTGYRILSKKISLWKAHLGWMVLEIERLKYLEKFLKK